MRHALKHWFVERLEARGAKPAFIWEGRPVSYTDICAFTRQWMDELDRIGVETGDSVAVQGDHSPVSFTLLLGLAARQAIVVPLTEIPAAVLEQRCEAASADWLIRPLAPGKAQSRRCSPSMKSGLLDTLRASNRAGLVLFSSGSSGIPKACLLDLDRLLETTKTQRKSWVTLAFLLFDHIGGINTMINVLGHGGTIVTVEDRTVAAIAEAIETHCVTLLPTSPTFLKMLLMSDAASNRDLSSLELMTYGTEPMPLATLKALHTAFPDVHLKQTYGLSEIGIVPTRSRSPGSLWMEIGGKDVEYRIIDNILWLRAPTAMLGYLNAPNPFDEDGWLNTGDRVEVDGKYLRILGRDSELINIGGEKVHPAEVEAILLNAPNVSDATILARPNPVTGSVLTAMVTLVDDENPAQLRKRLGQFCRNRLEPHKVPVSFKIADKPLYSARFKKVREQHA